MKVALIIVIGILAIVVAVQKIVLEALTLYIREKGILPDNQTISQYSEKAIKKFFHIPSWFLIIAVITPVAICDNALIEFEPKYVN